MRLLWERVWGGGSGTSVGKHRGKLLAHPTELAVGESLRGRGTSAGECRSKSPVHLRTP